MPERDRPETKAPTRRKSATPPSGPKWVHEIDGYRMQVRIEGQDIRLLTRKNIDWTKRFRSIAAALKELRVGAALLDGEIVVEDGNGVSSFNDLQSDLKAGRQDRFRYSCSTCSTAMASTDAGDIDRP